MKLIKVSCGKQVLGLVENYISDVDSSWNYITPEELNKKDLNDFYILDIRKPEDFKGGHIKGSNNIFWLDLFKEENLKELPRDKKILVVCYVGHTSSQALVLLRLLGYDVVSLKFGMGISPSKEVPIKGWLDHGYDVEGELNKKSSNNRIRKLSVFNPMFNLYYIIIQEMLKDPKLPFVQSLEDAIELLKSNPKEIISRAMVTYNNPEIDKTLEKSFPSKDYELFDNIIGKEI